MMRADPIPAWEASSGYGPPGGAGGPPPGGGYGPPPGGYGGPPPGGFGGPPPGGYGGPPGFGAPPPGQWSPGGPPGGPRTHTLAIVSLVAGLLSLPACCCWFGMPLPICAIVCGVIALGKIKSNPQVFKGTMFCTVGILTGSLGLLLASGFHFTNYGELFRHRYGKRF